MAHHHRKTTFKINGKEVNPRKEDTDEKEGGEQKNSAGKNDDREQRSRDVIDLGFKRKEWEERDRQSQMTSPGLPVHRKKKKTTETLPKRRWSVRHWKIPALIIAALSVGLMFGLPLLQLATNFSLSSEVDTTGNVRGGEGSPMAADEEDSHEQLQVDIVQAGVFSTEEASREMEEAFSEAGFPTVWHENDDMVYLYAGMTAHGTAEDEVLPEVDDAGLEGYVKTLAIPIAAEGMDAETQQAANDIGETLLTGLEATRPGASAEEEEAGLDNMDMDPLLNEDDEEAEVLSGALQGLDEEENADDHEAWMEATLAYEEWTNSFQ
ncbi:hypothetical protein [Natribacillus halophilus]|uniref:Stage II sporulation protein B n=1 Tax=Natribacillus halophilus TaxID=549003 RepID=A0A1G8LRT5_9BACI|nr:hypothetical protein [Natribacillus halophilus]SDI58398.1 hypothetical protein SAMN04488123_103238 [Natribacillus halophilus]